MATTHACLLAGLLAGLSVAACTGPMGAPCLQRALASGLRAGASASLGAATASALCGALAILGLDAFGPLIANNSQMPHFAVGLLLLWPAANALGRRRAAPRQHSPAAVSPLVTFRSAVASNASNPMLPARVVALLSPVVGPSAPSPAGAAALVVGMFIATAAWWACLTAVATLPRCRRSPGALVAVSQAARGALALYGAWALARSARM